MTRRHVFAVLWLLALAVPVGLELYGWVTPGQWDMLSEHVIPLVMAHPLVWSLSLSLYLMGTAALTWHWWFQYRDRLPRR